MCVCVVGGLVENERPGLLCALCQVVSGSVSRCFTSTESVWVIRDRGVGGGGGIFLFVIRDMEKGGGEGEGLAENDSPGLLKCLSVQTALT